MLAELLWLSLSHHLRSESAPQAVPGSPITCQAVWGLLWCHSHLWLLRISLYVRSVLLWTVSDGLAHSRAPLPSTRTLVSLLLQCFIIMACLYPTELQWKWFMCCFLSLSPTRGRVWGWLQVRLVTGWRFSFFLLVSPSNLNSFSLPRGLKTRGRYRQGPLLWPDINNNNLFGITAQPGFNRWRRRLTLC